MIRRRRTSAVSVSGSLHLSAAEGSERAAHLALLSGHARANGGAGQGIESVTDDQVTLRRHWQRPGPWLVPKERKSEMLSRSR